MKALSLTQPWATLIAVGAKRIETRSWYTAHRGLIAIHAAKGLGPVGGKSGLREQCAVEPFCSVLNAAIKRHSEDNWRGDGFLKKHAERPFMPLGAIVALAEIVACIPTNSQRPGTKAKLYNVARAGLPPKYVEIPAIDADEVDFGNYGPDRFMWFLENVIALPAPTPCRGALSLWDVPAEVEAQIREFPTAAAG